MFTSALAKIVRAEKQTERLETKVAAFLSEKNYEIRENLDPETGRKTATFHIIGGDIPIEWSVIVGEIIHDLRSALDTPLRI